MKKSKRHITVKQLYDAFACAIWIQGRQQDTKEVRLNTHALVEAFKDASRAMEPFSQGVINADLARRLNAKFLIQVGKADEKGLFERFRTFIAFAGEVIGNDEKVYLAVTFVTIASLVVSQSLDQGVRT